jgi:predicted SAM-dependent methyltransferase
LHSLAKLSGASVRLNLGCGSHAAPGWVNCDIAAAPAVELRSDLRRGLPLRSESADCIAAIHLLQDLSWTEIAPALAELHRVLRPGGVLRLAVPDLDRAIDAYLAGNRDYFYVPDSDARSAGAKLITQITWYGSVRTPLNWEFLEEWLRAAGFVAIERRRYGESRVPGLASLDNRERETLFVEATKNG